MATGKKKFSKNKKKNWRKHAKVDEIEEFLEEKRLEERIGGPASEKSNDDLFIISTEASDEGAERISRKNRPSKPLRSELNLLEVDGKQGKRKDWMMDSSDEDLPIKKTRGRSRISKASITNKTNKEKESKIQDLWDNSDVTADSSDLPINRKPKMPNTLAQTRLTRFPVVELPAPGTSYNPTHQDHQSLLREALEQEFRRKKKEEKVERWYNGLGNMNHVERQDTWLKEISEGLFEDNPGEESTNSEGEEYVSKRPVRAEDRKTQKQRRKAKEQKFERAKWKSEKERRQRENNIYCLKSLKRQIRERETVLKAKANKKLEQKKQQLNQPLRLGRLRFEDPMVDFKLTEELPDSLRKLKPEGSILRDRYKSLQKRNILEPRKKTRLRRKYKIKYVEKRSYKED